MLSLGKSLCLEVELEQKRLENIEGDKLNSLLCFDEMNYAY